MRKAALLEPGPGECVFPRAVATCMSCRWAAEVLTAAELSCISYRCTL